MPQKIICEKCEEILYMGDNLKSPEEVIQKFGGNCPKCKKELCFNAEKVEVKGNKK